MTYFYKKNYKTQKRFLFFIIFFFIFLNINNVSATENANFFAYDKLRLNSLAEERNKAIDLKNYLEDYFNTGKIPISAKNWNTVVNSYVYGGYPVEAIVSAIINGGKTVHPDIPWTAWRKSDDYKKYINKFLLESGYRTSTEIVEIDFIDELKSISAESAIAVDAQTGKILYGRNVDQKLPIASLTKLMSALVFLENNPGWDKEVVYSESDNDVLNYAQRWEMAYLKVEVGDKLTVEDLFYSGLVGSANNAIYALVGSTGLTRDEFVELMNEKAKELGLNETLFVEPSGLAPENVSSAKDYAKIASIAFKDDNIRLATSYRYWEFRTINDNKYHKVKSINKLLEKDLNFKIRGTKTGYLEEADRCLVAKGVSGDKEVIALVLGSHDRLGYFDEVERLIEYGLGIGG